MSLYETHSPVTNGEIGLAACEIINRSHDYFTNLGNRGNLQSDLQRMSNLLRFRFKKGDSYGCLTPSLREIISGTLARMEKVFGVPWENNEKRLEILSSFWSFKDLLEAQVEAPQYPYLEQIFGGQPFLLSEEKDLVIELMFGNMNEEALLSKINSDFYPQGRFSPDKFEMSFEGACRNFQLGIIYANRGDFYEALRQLVRSFLVFLPTWHLWWRKWIIDFLFSREPLAEIAKEREGDFAIQLLMEELDRQALVIASVDEFNEKTGEALAEFLDFEQLNSPFFPAAESQLTFGVIRDNSPWWKCYRK